MTDRSAASPHRRVQPPRLLVLGCGGAVLVAIVASLLVLAVVRPYQRASAYLTALAREAAPEGVEVTPVAVTFPARVRVHEVAIPPLPEHDVPALTLRDLTGTTGVWSWLQRRPAVDVSTRVWGGTLTLRGELTAAARVADPPEIPPLRVRAEAVDISLDDLSVWLGMPNVWRGRGRMELSGVVEPMYPRASVLSLNVDGQEWYVPKLDLGDVVLPPNRRTIVTGQALYRDEIFELQAFRMAGTGYDLEAYVRIVLAEPPERSPIRGRASLRLKERAAWRRPDVSEDYAEAMMQLLIASGGRIHARLGGTLAEPEAELEEAETITSVLRGE